MQAAALDAALAVARDQRLPADQARVLSARGNLLVHLAPSPVVARVATLTGTAVPPAASLGLFGRARDLEAAVWSLCMAHQYPARYQESAADLLAHVLSGSR